MKQSRTRIEIDGMWIAIFIFAIGAITLIALGRPNWEWMVFLSGAGIFSKILDQS